MPRNGSGTYTLPESAFVPNTPISSAAVNSDFSDIASALTGSLARDGQGGMSAVLPLANSGFTYLTDPNTGMRRTAADTQAISCGAIDIITATSTAVSVAGDIDVSGVIKNDGNPIWPVGFIGTWSGLTAPSKWVFARGQTLLRADYPDLWTFVQAEIAGGNTLYNNGNGTTTFGVANLTGYVLAGRESVATRLTSTYFGGNSTILGATGGLESATLTAAQLPSITSANASQAISVSTVNFVITRGIQTLSSATGGGGEASYPLAGGAVSEHAGSTGNNSISVTSTGTSGSPHNNTQPTTIVNFIIYAGV